MHLVSKGGREKTEDDPDRRPDGEDDRDVNPEDDVVENLEDHLGSII